METILIIDDDDTILETMSLFLTQLNYNVIVASDGQTGIDLMEKNQPDLIITDLKMTGFSGIDVLKKAKEYSDRTQVILITAYDDMQSTIKAMQLGAYDYVEKPIHLEKFKLTIKKALECKNISDKLVFAIDEKNDFSIETNFVGKTPQMKEIFKNIGRISCNKINILIQGESGTGKDIISRIIHYSGITKDYPFIAVNCTALTETLLESELFGHVKGAFTGAFRDKKGKFELADEGTIFLDEISEISPNLQVKLLRVIQEKEFERVGGEDTIPMRARIIAATNRDLQQFVEKGKFREDLYFRLNVFSIHVPPLRERKDDIPNLVIYFLNKINHELHKHVKKIPYEVMEILQNYDWIGNVRELENVLMQAVVLANGEVLEKENILLRNKNLYYERTDYSKLSIAEVEKAHIKLVLDSVNWNKKKTCQILGISKPTLNSKISLYNLEELTLNLF